MIQIFYCEDCDKELDEKKLEHLHGCLDCHGTVTSEKIFWLRKENRAINKKLEIAKEALEWIAKTDTVSHVHGPDVLWLTNWRNTRKAAAQSALNEVEKL